MRVEIWSDIVCPWCYIGRRRFEKALAGFSQRAQVAVTWRSFELDPQASREPHGSADDHLMQRYDISREKVQAMHAQLTALAAEEGLAYRFDLAQVVNTFDAHRLIHFAGEKGLQGEMKERLQQAYFSEGAVISDYDTLVRLAVEVGLEADETRRVLETGAYAEAVRADEQRAQALGIHGVPFFVLDGKYGVSGAQPVEVFQQALERAWAAHPAS